MRSHINVIGMDVVKAFWQQRGWEDIWKRMKATTDSGVQHTPHATRHSENTRLFNDTFVLNISNLLHFLALTLILWPRQYAMQDSTQVEHWGNTRIGSMGPCGFGVMSVLHLKRVVTKMFHSRLGSEPRMSSRSIFALSTRIVYSAISSLAVRLSSNDILRLNTPAMASRSPAPTLPNAKRYSAPFQAVPKLSQRNTIWVYISALLITANASPAPPPPLHPTVSKAQN